MLQHLNKRSLLRATVLVGIGLLLNAPAAHAWKLANNWENTVPGVDDQFVRANTAFENHQYAKAKAAYQDILRVTKTWGTYTPEFSDAMFKLGLIYMNEGNDTRAAYIFERLSEIDAYNRGPNFRDVALELGYLGDIYSRQGRVEEAESAYLRSLKIMTVAMNRRDPQVILALGNVADFYKKNNQPDKAEALESLAQQLKNPAAI